jgi:hypothetical protein
MTEDVFSLLLASIEANRLVVFSGAGLSMPQPSNLPSARVLAEQCAARHAELTGECMNETTRSNVEAQAAHFRSRAQLESYFIRKLVDWGPFAGAPNLGHVAIADFLLCGALDLSITTNFDILVELAAEGLGHPAMEAAVNGIEAASPSEQQPLLKLHGCMRRDREKTLWCSEQLTEPEWRQRFEQSIQWLGGRLLQKDLVFVGYWTDWNYLNDALAAILGAQVPRSVILVDPSSAEALEAKAPSLWAWAHRPEVRFQHVQRSGSDFLDELRYRLSYLLLRRIANAGASAFKQLREEPCPEFPILSASSTDDLYDLRRDWSGVRRDRVSRKRAAATSDEVLGKTFYELLALGATIDGSTLRVAGKSVRLIQGAGRMLYALKAELAGDMSPLNSPDVTICAGSDDDGGVPYDIVRAGRPSSIIRPGVSGEWCTHVDALDRLGV